MTAGDGFGLIVCICIIVVGLLLSLYLHMNTWVFYVCDSSHNPVFFLELEEYFNNTIDNRWSMLVAIQHKWGSGWYARDNEMIYYKPIGREHGEDHRTFKKISDTCGVWQSEDILYLEHMDTFYKQR